MNIRFLTPNLHALVDYAAAAGLIVFPFVLGLGASSPLAFWLSVVSGPVVIGYSLLTSYAFSAAQVLSFRSHLIIDSIAALAFAAAPFVFGFRGIDAAYYWIMAAAVFVVVALSRSERTEQPTPDAEAAVA